MTTMSSTVSPYLMVDSVESEMEFLVKVFNATITNDDNRKDGFIQHGEVRIGDSTIMMGRASKDWPGRESMTFVYVDNADAVYERALQTGAASIMPPDDRPYGLREAGFKDHYGNQWWVAHLLQKPDHTLSQTETDWTKAIEENKVPEMARYMHDDWLMVSNNGITGKSNFMNVIASGELVHNKMDFEIQQSIVYNNTGIVIAKGTSAGTWKGEAFHFHEWSTSIYIKEGKEWKAVLTALAPAR
jgi:PhnB protein